LPAVEPAASRDAATRGILSTVVEARLRWIFPEPVVIDPEILSAADRLGISPRVAELLFRRGVTAAAELDGFFAAPHSGLHDPRLLPDADVILERLTRARRNAERILLLGDFDADGLTGLAILTIALQRLGVAVEPYVPDRLEEGHGLSLAAIARAREIDATVIVTIDCGTTSHAEIAAAVADGIDVLVTDHHRVPAQLPPALAVVNPHRPDSRYPDRRLSGSAVAFKVAQLVLADQPGGPEAALALADLATIGGVADLAPVIGENRAIARIGLDLVRNAPRPGIAALLRRASIAPESVDLETIAFRLAPRLNAAGRVGEAMDAARLLLADDPIEAGKLADALEAANQTRRDVTRIAVDEARHAAGLHDEQQALVSDAAVVVRGDWSVGIIGLVASRLAEDLARPAVVGANLGSVVRGSCRSDGVLDLGAALEACGDLFLRFGGHAGAAGFELPTENWTAFRERFLLLAAATATDDSRPVARIDLAIPAVAVDYPLLRELANIGPCGPGNPDPLIAILGMTVTRVRLATGGHTQLTLRRTRDVIDAIAFDRPDLAEVVAEGDRVDVVGRLASRAFGGFESLQVEIRDVALSGAHPQAAAILALAAGSEAAPRVVVVPTGSAA
jgi:single-stranded-DNA-specific exonuclease